MPTFVQIFENLKNRFRQSFFRIFFASNAMGKLLSKNNSSEAWTFFEIYHSLRWWQRLWFRSYLDLDLKINLDHIINGIKQLKQHHLFMRDIVNQLAAHANPADLDLALSQFKEPLKLINFKLILWHDEPSTMGRILIQLANKRCDIQDIQMKLLRLQDAGVLTSAHLTQIASHANPNKMTDALEYLNRIKRLNQENIIHRVARHQNPFGLAMTLVYMNQKPMIAEIVERNFSLFANHQDPHVLVLVIEMLNEARLLTQKNIEIAANHLDLKNLHFVLRKLSDAGLLSQAYFNVVAMQADPCTKTDIIIVLHQAQLADIQDKLDRLTRHKQQSLLLEALNFLQGKAQLTEAHYIALSTRENLAQVRASLKTLADSRILTPDNIRIVCCHINPLITARVLVILDRGGILTPANCDLLLQDDVEALLTTAAHKWNRYSTTNPHPITITQADFAQLIEAARNPQGQVAHRKPMSNRSLFSSGAAGDSQFVTKTSLCPC